MKSERKHAKTIEIAREIGFKGASPGTNFRTTEASRRCRLKRLEAV